MSHEKNIRFINTSFVPIYNVQMQRDLIEIMWKHPDRCSMFHQRIVW
jgi:hypothetical protein